MSERFVILEDGTIFDTFNEIKFDVLEILAELEWYIDEYRNLEKKLEANQNQKAIECLKELKEELYKSAIQVVGTGVNAIRLYSINEIFDNKIKELEKGDV